MDKRFVKLLSCAFSYRYIQDVTKTRTVNLTTVCGVENKSIQADSCGKNEKIMGC